MCCVATPFQCNHHLMLFIARIYGALQTMKYSLVTMAITIIAAVKTYWEDMFGIVNIHIYLYA